MTWQLPEGVSTFSPTIDRMFYIILAVTGVAFVLTEVILIWFAIHYRRKPGVRATYTHGNNTLEVVWTVVPAVMLVFLAFSSRSAWNRIKGSIPETDQTVVITASQFNWEIRYEGVDKTFDTADDIVTSNDMRLPVNSKTKIRLRSKDVIHSFFLPYHRLKQDAVPGMTIDVWLEPTKTGNYEIACAELCGFGHYSMRGQLTVMEPAEYQAWIKEQEDALQAAPADATPPAEGGDAPAAAAPPA